jgi:splicing factor 3B subunit 3
MIGAVEKQKFVYVLNRDASNTLSISSPLEAHKPNKITSCICGVDVGFENPIFAALELDYAEADADPTGKAGDEAQLELVFYELDLGLNNVVRKWSDAVDNRSNLLQHCPGGESGPGGVLVFAEDFVYYKNQGHPTLRVGIPRRSDFLPPDRGVLLVNCTLIKQKKGFFFLAQSEYGDLYKLKLNYEDEVVKEIEISYFDTVPVGTSIAVLKTGFLFVAAECGDHALYQFQGLGDDAGDHSKVMTVDMDGETMQEGQEFIHFTPRPLKNLMLADEVANVGPIMGFMATNVFEGEDETPQLHLMSGWGHRSSMRTLRHGLSVTPVAVTELSGNPSAIWALSPTAAAVTDRYLVVSFAASTMVLAVGESVEEVSNSDFLPKVRTLCVGQVGTSGMVQIHPGGIRVIQEGKSVHDWPVPASKSIVAAACSQRQVVIALDDGSLTYFVLSASGILDEVVSENIRAQALTVDLAPTPEGLLYAPFVALGCGDNSVKIYKLDGASGMVKVATQSLSDAISAVSLFSLGEKTLYLAVGTRSGVMSRSVVDLVHGTLSNKQQRFLGSHPVKLVKVGLLRGPALLALSSRPWICFAEQPQMHVQMLPLSYDVLEYAAGFHTELCPRGIVAISGKTLRIVGIDAGAHQPQMFNQISHPLRYTPRKFVVHPPSRKLIVLESDQQVASEILLPTEGDDMELDGPTPQGQVGDLAPPADQAYGPKRAGRGIWSSCIRVLDPRNGRTSYTVRLEGNQAAFSICFCRLPNSPWGDHTYLIVGTAKDLTFVPRSCTAGYIYVYQVTEDGNQLKQVHCTEVDNVPYAMCSFQGYLLVGVGKSLRLYDAGRSKLLKKCELNTFPSFICSLQTQGDRVVVGDIQESFHMVSYKRSDNLFSIFADDTMPRYLTASVLLDYDTVAGADKFGNFFVLRLPSDISEDVDDDLSGSAMGGRVRWDRALLSSAPHKLDALCKFHVGDIISCLDRVVMVPGGKESIFYTTIMGSIGAFSPFASKEDVDFFIHLEMHMRVERPSLCGRDHLSFRSVYYPVKDVVDGDLCEQFLLLDSQQQANIAGELNVTVPEVIKKLETMRNVIL